jgi:hypothetical protein
VSLQIKKFNDKIKVMNQSQSRDLILSAADARNLHAEIYALLAQVAEYASAATCSEPESQVIQINMDGGGYK